MSCDPGFELEAGKCTAVECTCANGVGATGAACPADGAALCVACDPGYALVAFGSCR